jgi:hypothetical protein
MTEQERIAYNKFGIKQRENDSKGIIIINLSRCKSYTAHNAAEMKFIIVMKQEVILTANW